MSWDYRIIKHDTSEQIYFAVHEVFYDASGKPESWTAEPIDIVGDSKKDVIGTLQMMSQDCKKSVLSAAELLKSIESKQ